MNNCKICDQNSKAAIMYMGVNADHPESHKLPILRCGNCGHLFTDEESISSLESELYFEGYYGEETQSGLVNKIATAIFQKERQMLTVRKVSPNSILDVGCGDGLYLRHLPPSLEKSGFEPSDAGKKAITINGLQFFDIYTKNDKQFDLITMWQSLEHIQKPIETLKILHDYLTPHGHLFISVPNSLSLQSLIFKGRWFHLDPTRHRHHFNTMTLKSMMAKSGFEIVSISHLTIEYGIYGWWQSFLNLLPIDFNMAYKILKGRKKYSMNPKVAISLIVHVLLAIPLVFLSTIIMLFETCLGRGAAIHILAKPK